MEKLPEPIRPFCIRLMRVRSGEYLECFLIHSHRFAFPLFQYVSSLKIDILNNRLPHMPHIAQCPFFPQ